MMMEREAKRALVKKIKNLMEITTFESSKKFGRPKTRFKWVQDGL